ncbi:Transcription activator of gluconeogenesis ERT1 [Abortiporus biennis]
MLSSPLDDRPSLASSISHPQLILPAISGVSTVSSTTSNTPTIDLSSKKMNNTSAKRKRPNDGASDSNDSSSQQTGRTRDGPKKKKANRACFHCQKAHLTCDDSRPCQRCIKRGMADNCTEGHRKKAKYLLDDDELEALKRSKSGEPSKPAEPTPQPQPQPPPPPRQNSYIPQPESIFSTYDPSAPYNYGTTDAANLEYSIISSILGNSPDSANSAPTGRSTSYAPSQPATNLVTASWPAEPMQTTYGAAASPRTAFATGTATPTFSQTQTSQQPMAIQPSETTGSGSSFIRPGDLQYSDYSRQQDGQASSSSSLPHYTGAIDRTSSTATPTSWNTHPPTSLTSAASDIAAIASTGGYPVGLSGEASSVYKTVTKGYDYTEGYHFLMKHLCHRGFEKNDILRIVRALAIFRPSLIALQMPMTEEDEVFIEKCFQRSLVELDKLISFGGTPTVAWRRTGEICLVGPEFSMLTGWDRDELIGKKKFIYELFENQSVVEYWENFANHAFENTTQSVYSHCVLLKPSGAPVPCTFCFSIRRDIMDLPSLVIGQWLPLL